MRPNVGKRRRGAPRHAGPVAFSGLPRIGRVGHHFTDQTLTGCRSTCPNSCKPDSSTETSVERISQKPRAPDARRGRTTHHGGSPAWPVRTPRLRVQAGQRGTRYAGDPAVPGSPEHRAHRPLYGAGPWPLQSILERLAGGMTLFEARPRGRKGDPLEDIGAQQEKTERVRIKTPSTFVKRPMRERTGGEIVAFVGVRSDLAASQSEREAETNPTT